MPEKPRYVIRVVVFNHATMSACWVHLNTPKELLYIKQTDFWLFSAEGPQHPACILPALCRKHLQLLLPRTASMLPGFRHCQPAVPAVTQPGTAAQRRADIKASLKVPMRNTRFWYLKSEFPLRKWKERGFTLTALVVSASKWADYVIWWKQKEAESVNAAKATGI